MNEIEQPSPSSQKTLRQVGVTLAAIFAIGLTLALLLFLYLARPPADFPVDSTLNIAPGENVRTIVNNFAAAEYVRSSDLLYLVLIMLHDATDIQAGVYEFTTPASVVEVARLITEVGPKDELVKITIPEGLPSKKIATIAEEVLPNFDAEAFLSLASNDEGILFPDTYFVPKDFTAEQLHALLRRTFQEKVEALFEESPASNLTTEEVIILASILEREANSPESMALVSGVLHNRLAIDMPLQADATIEYILDKPLSELVPADLEVDSPYNTYLYRGLTPTPIGNPGLVAIEAALNPTSSDYFYYITDAEGEFHFGKTFDEHRENIARYLR